MAELQDSRHDFPRHRYRHLRGQGVLVDDDEAVVGEASAPVATDQPRPGWSEQDPEDWWRATEAVAEALKRESPAAFREIAAIGLSGQMHGAVLLDERDAPIRPAIIWNDGRAVAECRELEEEVPQLPEIAGVIAMPGFTAPKLRWLWKHEPDAFARARKVLLAKDFVRLKLTGEFATDMADAAGTLLLDEAKRDWSEPILAAAGVRREMLPRLLEGSMPSGRVRGDPRGLGPRPGRRGGGRGRRCGGRRHRHRRDRRGRHVHLARHLGAVFRHARDATSRSRRR